MTRRATGARSPPPPSPPALPPTHRGVRGPLPLALFLPLPQPGGPALPPRGHEAKRVSIIDAAGDIFCREGYAGANIDLIAAEAGVSRQTVYNHHRDKEKLFIAVIRDAGR